VIRKPTKTYKVYRKRLLEITYVNVNIKNIVSAGLRIRRSSSEVIFSKFSWGDKYYDSIKIAGLALVACNNKILLHALKIRRNEISTFLTRASDISVETEREISRNVKETQERKIFRRKRRYLYYYGIA
jgi:hypothetical protein